MRNGLSNKEVLESRKKHGSNQISSQKRNSFLTLFIETLGDPIIKILLIALAIKTVFLFQDFNWFETLGIVIAIFIASFISTISEYGSEAAFEKLQEESSKINCKVKREGKIIEIPIDEVVVGDFVLLQVGDKIPADGIIVEGDIYVDESSMNGETKEIHKTISLDNQVYRGTVVYQNNAYMLVKKVGDNTFYGHMAKELQEKSPESPLKNRLRNLAKIISRVGYISAILVSVSYLFGEVFVSNQFDMIKIRETITNFHLMFSYLIYALTLSVTIIVVAVPEGLPMMITLVLSSNMRRMLKNNVLVRKMVGIETAGSLNILFTDKTGTLTKGKLQVTSFMSGSGRLYENKKDLMNHKELYEALKYNCLYNNDSSYNEGEIIGGNITDRAISEYISAKEPLKYKKLEVTSFNSKNKYSSVSINTSRKTNYIKGAPDVLLKYCRYYLSESGRKQELRETISIQKRIEEEAKKGIRVILLAYNDSIHCLELNNLTLIGFLFIKDEIRKEAIEGVKLVKQAGIQTVMITGDNKETAISIAKEAKIIEDNKDLVLTSKELNSMTDNEIKKVLPRLRVVARSLPKDKSRLVRLSEELGLVVGMTGDGVNDAPALKHADVGFAMGSGTEVCKEASDIVILDDNFLSISKAILYGRTIFKSIRKFIIFQLTINLCAISLSIIGPFIGVETPVTVIQMLWINMIMDTLAGIAFSYEPPLKHYMLEKPKKREENIINKYMYSQILFTGIYSSLLCIFFLKSDFVRSLYRSGENYKYLMTAFFTLFIFVGIFNSFNARTTKLNIFSDILKNKTFLLVIAFIVIVQLAIIYFGGGMFRSYGLLPRELLITILFSLTVIPIDVLRKYLFQKRKIQNQL